MADRSHTNRRRLCHVITTPVEIASGLRTRLEAEIGRDLGINIDMVTGWRAEDEANCPSNPLEGITYHRLPVLTKYISPSQDIKAFIYLYKLFKKNRYHAVQTHLSKAGVLGRIAAGLAGIPIIIHDVAGYGFPPSHSSLRKSFYSALERLAGHFTTHFIFYAQHLRDTYLKIGIGQRAVKKVIYPGMDLNKFFQAPPLTLAERARARAAWHLAKDDLVIGWVGRMVPSKGHHFLIHAFHNLAPTYPRLKLFLVGGPLWAEESKYFLELQNLVQRLGLQERVVFSGHQSQIVPFYQMFDFFVMPSLYEGTANVMLEALSIGLPLVSFDLPAVGEFAPSNAVVCPLGDVRGLSRGIEQVIINGRLGAPDFRPPREFRKRLVEKFSPVHWKKQLSSFYREVKVIGP